MKIKGNREFYRMLRQLEKPIEIDGELFFTLSDVPDNDPTLQQLRSQFVFEDDTDDENSLADIKSMISKSPFRHKDVANLLGLTPNVFGTKLRGMLEFTAKEITGLERVLKLDSGTLQGKLV